MERASGDQYSKSGAMLDVATSIAATGSGTLTPTHRGREKYIEKVVPNCYGRVEDASIVRNYDDLDWG